MKALAGVVIDRRARPVDTRLVDHEPVGVRVVRETEDCGGP